MSRVGILLFFTTVLLSLLGVFILYESSSYTARLQLGDAYYFAKYQLLWTVVGIVIALVISRFNYHKLKNLAFPFLIISMVLLLVVFIPGIGLNLQGASRWIDLQIFVIQPSEILKITLALYLAAWLSIKEKGRFLAFILLIGVCIGLVILQPDMDTAFVIAVSAITVYFLSGAPIRNILLIFLVGIIGIFALIKMEPYRVARLTAYQNFNVEDMSGASYHVKQILIAVGSGGVTGVGLGNSVQKYAYLPEATTDSIFAIYAEETGFIGGAVLIALLLGYVFLGFMIAARAPDLFSRLLAAGIIMYLSIQTVVNLASQLVLIPLTGIPLPFISYGGSSMLINFAAIGILLSISRHLKKTK